jgi:AcrR family transcriptional regulator
MKSKRARPAAKSSYHHGSLRRALIDAAAELAAERRAATVSLRAVAKRAGVSQAAPYHYFADQSALWAAVAEAGFDLLDATQMAAIAQAPSDAVERLASLMATYVRFALDRPQHFKLMFGQSAAHGMHPPAGTAARRVSERVADAVRAARIAHGHDDLDSSAITMMILAVPHGLATLSLNSGGFASVAPRFVEDLARAATLTLAAAAFEKAPEQEWGI